MDRMELNEFLGNMEHLVDLLHGEWDQSGRTEAVASISLADREAVRSRIAGEIMESVERQKRLEAADSDFEECMALSKENFVLLRLAKKIREAVDEAVARGHAASFSVEMDGEEYGLFGRLFAIREV